MLKKQDVLSFQTAWEQYERDAGVERLLETLSSEPQRDTVFQLLLWRAIGSCDQRLISALEDLGIGLPPEEEQLFSALEAFGDAPKAVEWLIARGASLSARSTNDWTPLHIEPIRQARRLAQQRFGARYHVIELI